MRPEWHVIRERMANERWKTSVHHGSVIHVAPVKGCGSPENWALTLNPRRSTGFWRCITGIYIRREFPKNETQLRKAIADCDEWCRRMNAHEAELAGTVARVARPDSPGDLR